MGIYLLRCDTQHAQEIIDEYVEKPGSYRLDISVTIKHYLAPIKARSEQASFLSLKVDPAQKVRKKAIAAMWIGIVACELFTLLIARFALTAAMLPFLIIALPWVATLFTPLLTLRRLEFRCDIAELLLRRFFTDHGVSSHMLIPPRNRVWFYGDAVIIFAVVIVAALVQVFAFLDLWAVVPVIAPLLVFLGINVLLGILYTFSFDLINELTRLHLFWKIAVTRFMAGRVFLIAIMPLLLFLFLFILGNIGVAVSVISTHMPRNKFVLELTSFNTPAYLNNPFIQQMGYVKYIVQRAFMISPGNETNQYAFHVAVYVGLVSLALFMILQFITLREFRVWKMDSWEELELLPTIMPPDMAQGMSDPKVNSVILVNWMLNGIINVVSVGIVILGLLVISNIAPSWVPLYLTFPFLWYHAMFEVAFGIGTGDILACFVLFILFSPLLTWLLFWVYSLVGNFWKACATFFPQKSKNVVQAMVNGLCQQVQMDSPKVSIERGSVEWPVTIPTLPFARFCVIRISDTLVEKLTTTQLQLMLTHELGHVKKHMKKLWITQLLSRLSFMGPGYLTVLLNYWNMEMEADDFAVQILDERRELIFLLEQLGNMKAEVESELWDRLWRSEAEIHRVGRSPHQETKGNTKIQWVMVYKILFGATIWGAAHPPNEIRIENLRQRGFITPRLISKDRNTWFDNLTERAKNVLSFAEEEARRLQHNYIGTEHLLLGLVSEDEGVAFRALNLLGVKPDEVRRTVELITGHSDQIVNGEIELTPQAQKVIELASDEAHQQHYGHIDTEHLLIGLLREGKGIGAGVLQIHYAVSIVKVREAIKELLQRETQVQQATAEDRIDEHTAKS